MLKKYLSYLNEDHDDPTIWDIHKSDDPLSVVAGPKQDYKELSKFMVRMKKLKKVPTPVFPDDNILATGVVAALLASGGLVAAFKYLKNKYDRNHQACK